MVAWHDLQDASHTSRRRISDAIFLDVLSSKSASFIHENVRHISYTRDTISFEAAAQALSKCTGTKDVMLFYESSPELLPSLGMMPLLRLSVWLTHLFGQGNPIDFQHPVFEQLTHLAISDGEDAMVLPSGLARLPCLTHISLNWIWSPEFHIAVLAQCPRLEVLSVLVYGEDTIAKFRPHHTHFSEDARSVLMNCPGLLRDWELGADGGADHWVRAERFIAKRRTGAVKGESRQTLNNS